MNLTDENRQPRRNLCRPCYVPIKRAESAESYRRNRDRRRATMKAYYEAHAEEERERTRRWREENKDRLQAYRRSPDRKQANVEGQRRRRLASHGLTPDAYDRMLEDQGGGCAICGTTDTGRRTGVFAIDHDHRTGRVRGLLCSSCNNGLGRFGDDPDRLERAAQYLRYHPPLTVNPGRDHGRLERK